MRNYVRTLFTGILGLIGGSIAYFKGIPILIQIAITICTGICVIIIALYDRKKQLENDLKILVDRMRNHLNFDYHTNHSESEKPLEAQRLFWFFKDVNKTIRLKAISNVFKVPVEDVNEMLKNKYPQHLIESDAFKITNR